MKYSVRVLIVAAIMLVMNGALVPGWQDVLSVALIAGVLCWVAESSQTGGAGLVLALAGLYYVPQILLNIPEGVLFDVIEIGQAPLMMAGGLIKALIFAGITTMLFARDKAETSVSDGVLLKMNAIGFLWRVVAAVVVFIICYAVAGMIIFPFVKEYYAVRTMPEPLSIMGMQVLRAVALLITALGLLSVLSEAKKARLILAVSFPVLGCIAVMIPDNELMPPMVRLVHTLEVTPYYALYGFLMAWWFGRRSPHSPVYAS